MTQKSIKTHQKLSLLNLNLFFQLKLESDLMEEQLDETQTLECFLKDKEVQPLSLKKSSATDPLQFGAAGHWDRVKTMGRRL